MHKLCLVLLCIFPQLLNADSTQTDYYLASCLSNILSSRNNCEVLLDLDKPEQKKTSDSLIKIMKKGNTSQTIFLDKKGNRYTNIDEFEKKTGGEIFCQIYFISKLQFYIFTAINNHENIITKERRDNDFRFAIDSLIDRISKEE